MATKTPKNSNDWMRISQFIIFGVSCVIAVVVWYYSQQSQIESEIASKYVSKTELMLIEQKLSSLEASTNAFKDSISEKLDDIEATNDELIDLITDIRLTMARQP
jgi:type II secretory pathway pseudopilin PulG|tara:strand:- start:131 stop:445 length:315 start_codon:yes stop_codon:yes gene_type:complete